MQTLETNAVSEVDVDDLSHRAAPMDITGIDEAARTVPATISTEQPVTVFDPINNRAIDEVLVARGGKFPNQLPLLDDHSRAGSQSVLGSARNIRMVDGKWKSMLHFAVNAGKRADEVWELVRQKHLTDVSIGYRYDRNPSSRAFVDIPPGKSQSVDGQVYTARSLTLRVVASWYGREVSTTPIGADDQAKIGRSLVQRGIGLEPSLHFQESIAHSLEASNSASRSNSTEGKMDQTSTPTESQTRSDATAAADATVGQSTQPIDTRSSTFNGQALPPVTPAATTPAASQVQTAEQIRAERERVAFIYQQRGNLADDIVNRAIVENWDTSRINSEFATARTTMTTSGRSAPIGSTAPAGHVVDRQIDVRTLQAAMLLRSGISPDSQFLRTTESDFALRASRESKAGWIADSLRSLNTNGDLTADAARAWDKAFTMRSMSMVDICSAALDVEGVNYNRYDRDEIMERSFSTATLNAVFTTNFNAQLLEGFMGIADTTTGWVKVAQLPNFQLNERIQMHKFGRLRKVDRNQEIQDAAAQAVYESYKLGRYAEKFAVDEMDIMDDRFGALDMTPQDMGEAAGEIRPDLVYAILLGNPTMGQDNTALFDAATHANYTASGAGLSSTALAAARVAVMSQKSNGRYINAMARNLIVPLSDEHTASVIVNSAERRDTTSSTEYGTKNWAQGKFNIVAEPRLDGGVIDPSTDTTIAGQPGTFFLATDNGRGGIEVGYLAGTGGVPVVRRYTLDSGKLGMGWMVVMYVAAKATGYQGLYCSKA